MFLNRVTFKERYQSGLCDLNEIESFTEQWEKAEGCTQSLREYLGLTEFEYATYLRDGLGEDFQQMLDSGRICQKFRIYQLDLQPGKTVPFAFEGIAALRKAGYEQPPASEYRLVHEGSMMCPKAQTTPEVLERIFARYNDNLPEDYHGRSVSLSDVVELYDGKSRSYYYCDTVGFIQVKFSPMLTQRGASVDTVKGDGAD